MARGMPLRLATRSHKPARHEADGANEGHEGASGGHAPNAPQIELGEALAVPEEGREGYVKYSRAHMERLRDGARLARAKAASTKAKAELEQASGALAAVCTLLPGAASLVNAPRTSHIGRKHDPKPNDFVLAVRGLHLPPNSTIRLGVRLDRLQATGARLVLRRQETGLDHLLSVLGLALTSANSDRNALLSFAHMWDEVGVKFQWAPE